MAESDQAAEKTVTIDGVDYSESQLSDTAKSQIGNLRFVEKEIEDTNNRLAVLQAARQFYAGRLSKELPENS